MTKVLRTAKWPLQEIVRSVPARSAGRRAAVPNEALCPARGGFTNRRQFSSPPPEWRSRARKSPSS